MKFGLQVLCIALAGCAPVATMGDTDGDTDTDTDSATTETMTMSSSSPSTTMSSSNGSSPTTTPPPTTMESTQGSTGDPPMTSDETSACPPGTEDCPCDIGSTCDADLLCIDGACVAGIPCDEPEEEPNNTVDEAIDLGPVACSMEFQMTDGALAGVDMDVYAFTEGAGGVIPCFGPEPILRVDADADLRTCVYIDCGDQEGSVNCDGFMSTQEEDTFEELPGCCDSGGVRLFGHDCAGFGGDPPTFYTRVISSDAEACIPYTLNLRFE